MKILPSFVKMNNFNSSKHFTNNINNKKTDIFVNSANTAFTGDHISVIPEIKFEQQCKMIDKFLTDGAKDIYKLYDKETKTREIQSALKNVETELLSYDAKLSDFELDYSSKLSPEIKEKLIEYRNHKAFSSEISSLLISDIKSYDFPITKREKNLIKSLDKCKPYVDNLKPLVDKYTQADLPLPIAIYPYFNESTEIEKTLENIRSCALLVPYEQALKFKQYIDSGRINEYNFECSHNFEILMEDINSYYGCKKEISKLINNIKVPDIDLEKIEESRMKVFDYLVNKHQEKADEINKFYKHKFLENNTFLTLKQTQKKQKQILDSLEKKWNLKGEVNSDLKTEVKELPTILPFL